MAPSMCTVVLVFAGLVPSHSVSLDVSPRLLVSAIRPAVRRCAPPQALAATLDLAATSGCLIAVVPGVVGAAWAAQMREAREQYDAAKAAFESETLACLKGEGCPIQLETAEAALSAATARIDQINPFTVTVLGHKVCLWMKILDRIGPLRKNRGSLCVGW